MADDQQSRASTDDDGERSRLRGLVRHYRSGRTGITSGLACLCTVAVDELAMSGAVVSLMATSGDSPGHLGAIATSSSERVRLVEELEFSLGEGPGRDAFLTSRPVLTPDLARAVGRWPGYAPAACAAGSHAVFAFPMHVGAMRFGVLSLHMSRPRSLTPHEIATSLRVTDLATDMVLDCFPSVADLGASELPQFGVDRLRDQVYQAQGMVKVQLGVSLSEALARLRAHAFASDQDLADLAADVLAERVHLSSERDGGL